MTSSYHLHHYHPGPSHIIAHLDYHKRASTWVFCSHPCFWTVCPLNSRPETPLTRKSDHVTLLLTLLHWLSYLTRSKIPSPDKSQSALLCPLSFPPLPLFSLFTHLLTSASGMASAAAPRLSFAHSAPAAQASFCASNTRGTFLPQGLRTCHFPLSAVPFSRYPHNPPSCFLQVSTHTSPHQRTFLSHTQRKEQNHLHTTEGPLFSLSGPDTAWGTCGQFFVVSLPLPQSPPHTLECKLRQNCDFVGDVPSVPRTTPGNIGL